MRRAITGSFGSASECKLIFLLMLQLVQQVVNGQYFPTPPIACPEVFQYVNYDGQNIGKITLNVFPGTTVVDVSLSQQIPVRSDYSGRLTLLDGQTQTINNIFNGDPVHYRVDFPLRNVLPKVTKIAVNGSVICSAAEYPPPRTNLMLQNTLTTSTTHFFRTLPLHGNNREQQPPFEWTTQRISPATVQLQSQPLTEPVTQPLTEPQQLPQQQPQLQSQQNLMSDSNYCGQAAEIEISSRIMGGSTVERGTFPWLVAIYDNIPESLKFRCGGNLISSRTVISAAHCFNYLGVIKSVEETLVIMGRHNLMDWTESSSITRTLQSVSLHPDYDGGRGGSFDADIAVILLKESVSFSDMIRPICLWNEPNNPDLIDGSEGVIVGWGHDENGQITSLPKKVLSTIVSERTCLRSKEEFRILTSNRTICAGNRDNNGPCTGDSGSGLMLNRKGRWVLRGTVSASLSNPIEKCNLKEYVVYCDVSMFVSWIQKIML